MVAEIKVSTWRKTPSGRNINTRLPWGHVDVHSISQYSVDHRLPFVARRVDVMVPTRQLLRPCPTRVCPVPGPEQAQGLGLGPALQSAPISEKSERYWIL